MGAAARLTACTEVRSSQSASRPLKNAPLPSEGFQSCGTTMVSGARSPRRNRTAASDSSRCRIAVIEVRLPGPGPPSPAAVEVTTTLWPSVSASAGAGSSNIASVSRIVEPGTAPRIACAVR